MLAGESTYTPLPNVFRRLSNEIRLGTGRWSLAALLLAAAVTLPLLALKRY